MITDLVPFAGPISKELRQEVKSQLEIFWNFYRRHGDFRRDTRLGWRWSCRTMDCVVDHEFDLYQLKSSLNKLTTIYMDPLPGRVNGVCSPIVILASIYQEWFLHFNDEPNVEFGHFFAEPAHITSIGPTPITQIVESHKRFCDKASHLFNAWESGILANDYHPDSLYIRDGPKNYKLLPLYRAVILILDELSDWVDEVDEDDKLSISKFSKDHSILMIRTGDEAQLSTPINFDPIRAHQLPLRRDKPISGGIEVIRVSLTTAVHFIADLQEKEEAAHPSTNTTIDKNINVVYEAWTAEDFSRNYLEDADKKGWENCGVVQRAL